MIETTEYVDFLTIRKYIDVTDHDLFIVYLKEIYKDLSCRAEATRKNGVTKLTFLDYMKLPVFIGEKLFESLDKDADSYLNSKEFVEGMGKLYLGDFLQTIASIFCILDFDKDGVVSKEDTRLLLSYLPLKCNNKETEYKFQMESLDEIDEIVKHTFDAKNLLSFEDFVNVVEKKKSDVFLQLLCFIYQNKPFNENYITKLNFSRRKLILENSEKQMLSPQVSKRIPSPNKKTILSPVHSLLRKSSKNLDDEYSADSLKCQDSPHKSGFRGMVRLPNETVINLKKLDDQTNDLDSMIKKSKTIFESPTIIRRHLKNFSLDNEFNLENNLTQMTLENREIDLQIEFESWIYGISQSQKLKRYWLVLKGKDIYYYKDSEKEELLGMHNLSGYFVNDNGEKEIIAKKFYSFNITLSGKTRSYYCEDKNLRSKWISKIEQAIGYMNFFDYYEMLEDLGQGNFGKVKLGIYKKTKEKVAIKIIKKSSLENVKDIELVKSEIDIMKLCRHPNVVKLLDHFENSEYIFIVMELLEGGSLGDYFSRTNYQFTERRAANIMFQLASGLKYLHQYGILHRDIKPENIMLTSKSDDARVKIMDFGLSKIIGAHEKLADGYGSLSFVAPEVLVREPYNKQIDIWSLGIILYYMLSGTLPFDDAYHNQDTIAKAIVFSDVKFPSKLWSKRSPQVVDIISKCLIKVQKNRITVDEFLGHEWIINNIK